MKGLGSSFGPIKKLTKANGKITKCMVEEFLHGQMEGGMKDSMLTTKSKGLELSSGQMGESMKDSGNRATSTAKVNTKEKMESGSQDTGKTVRESDELHFYRVSNPLG